MQEPGIRTLDTMKTGQKGTVVALNGGREFQTRMVSMGVNIGSDIEVVHSRNGYGGPVLIAAGEARLAIGHGMLDRVLVAVDLE